MDPAQDSYADLVAKIKYRYRNKVLLSKAGAYLAGFALLIKKAPEDLVQDRTNPTIYLAKGPTTFNEFFAVTLRLVIQEAAKKALIARAA